MFIVSRDVDGLGKTVIQAISFSATANSYTTDLCVQLRSRKHTNAKPSSEFKLPRGNLILRDGTTTNQSRAARRRGKLNDIYKVYIIISEILMILVQISLRNGLRSALTLSKLKFISGGACPQTPLVGAASAALLSLHPLFKIPGYATENCRNYSGNQCQIICTTKLTF